MPKFSFKRSQTIDSDESEKSLPLNDTYTKDEVVGVQKKQGLVEKLKNKARRKRSKSPSRTRSKSPGRSYFVSEVGRSQPLKPSKKKQKRQGTNFCGVCDMRIAVALLSTLHILVAIVMELIEASKYSFSGQIPVLLLTVVAISGMGLFGALHFFKIPLILSSISLFLLGGLYLSEWHLIGLTLAVILFIAQVILTIEIHDGIMTPETYHREEYITPEGRKMMETAHGLSVDIGETANEFAEEVVVEFKRQSSQPTKEKKVDKKSKNAEV